MKEKNLDGKLNIIFFIALIFILMSAFRIYFNTKANFLYEKAIRKDKPAPAAAKSDYYKYIFSLLNQAIALNNKDADFYAKKAEYLSQALDEGFKEALAINPDEIIDLYKKAITLNPINYEYHLQLGWFYLNKGDTESAQNGLLKAAHLYPTNFQVYLYLSRYYLKLNDEGKAFNNLILSMHYAGKRAFRMIINAIKQDIGNSSALLLNEKAREVKFITYPINGEISFKHQGFPHEKIPLKIRVFVKKGSESVSLIYKGNIYKVLLWADNTPELDIYEINLDTFAADAYLDDFAIKISPPINTERIEFIYKF